MRQCQAHTGKERGKRRRQDQPPQQQVARQAQHGGGLAQARLGIAHADEGVQRHRHDDGLDQHHQLEQLANAEEQHEQRNPGQGRDLRQGTEGGQHQALGKAAEAEPGAQGEPAENASQQPPGEALEADAQLLPQLAGEQLAAGLEDQFRCRQNLRGHPVAMAGDPPEHADGQRQQPRQAGLQPAPGRPREPQARRGKSKAIRLRYILHWNINSIFNALMS